MKEITTHLDRMSDLICQEEYEKKGSMVSLIDNIHLLTDFTSFFFPSYIIYLSPFLSSPSLQGNCMEFVLRHKLLDMLVATAKSDVSHMINHMTY